MKDAAVALHRVEYEVNKTLNIAVKSGSRELYPLAKYYTRSRMFTFLLESSGAIECIIKYRLT